MAKKKIRLFGKMKTLALATDGSSFSDGAVQEAIYFAQECEAKIVVLNVIAIDSETATSAHSTSTAKRQTNKDYIDNIKKMANASDIKCKIVIEESYQPDKTLVELAYKHKADVLIMGRHGERGLLKLMVGSMTSKVIGYGFPQVLVVPEGTTITGKKILLATDGSPFGKMALKEAISVSKHCAALKKVYVVSAATKKSTLGKAQQLVEKTCQKIGDNTKNVKIIPVAAVGRPSEIITETTRKNKIDLIIIGSHGKGISKLLMGHVTEKVIGSSNCAVLVIAKNRKWVNP